jgi:hypothetical protein
LAEQEASKKPDKDPFSAAACLFKIAHFGRKSVRRAMAVRGSSPGIAIGAL